jgi:hypothetical protein
VPAFWFGSIIIEVRIKIKKNKHKRLKKFIKKFTSVVDNSTFSFPSNSEEI